MTSPSPVILGKGEAAIDIRIKGLSGKGPVRAAANVGKVESVALAPRREIRVRWSPPAERFPQVLCLILWRASLASRPWVVRVPLHGQTQIPIRTRRKAQVNVTVGERQYGPLSTGWRGRLKVQVVVAPGIHRAKVDVTDRVGMVTHKTIRIETGTYRPVTLAVVPVGNRHRLAVATARRSSDVPTVEVDGEPVGLTKVSGGLWTAEWTPNAGHRGRTVTVRAWLPEALKLDQQIAVQVPANEPKAAKAEKVVEVEREEVKEAPTAAPTRERRVHGVAGVAVGMLHNTGALLSPRFGAELGLDLRLPVGWIGIRALVGLSFASQQIAGPQGMGDAESRVLLLPLGAGLTYRLPFSWLTPYALVGIQGQLVRTTASAEFLEDGQQDSEWVFTMLGMLGAERSLGPGLVFLQAGFQWARVESPAADLLAGGVVVEAGYRFRL